MERAESRRMPSEQIKQKAPAFRHDVIGHTMAGISVQAGVGIHLIATRPAQAVEALSAIKQISVTIGRISEIALVIAASVEQQGSATQEIVRSVQGAAQSTNQVATNITEVNKGANETSSASSQVLSSAQSLSGESNRLTLEVDRFLETVRAA